MLRIGIDIGGTFTDFVVYDTNDGRISTFKLLSDNSNPANTVIRGLKQLKSANLAHIVHGSTVATNALLERKGARTALITTRGFKDVLQIGRQNRPNLYDWHQAPPPPLVPANLRIEVNERIDSNGNVVTPLDIEQLEDILKHLVQSNIESIAVCLLFSFLYPKHEEMIVTYLRNKNYFVSASSEILPEYREYERTSTTVVNAYVSPILDRYLSTIQKTFPQSTLQMMQSNGGMINFEEAKHNGAHCILSGPAGGIVGAKNICQTIINNNSESIADKKVRIITFDMGGTSTDVSLIDGEPSITTEAIVGGCPIHLPLLDIHTIGSGGGSIAYVDPGGSLRVGPESVGSDPGPACYGKGELPTVTDANLVLGRILPHNFLGGQMEIYPERALIAISKLGRALNLTPIQAAYGVIDVVNIQMERALRVISVERGHDPRQFNLFSFGGAGGLHAADLARHLGIPRVIISKFASTLSALGMLVSNVIKDYVQTVMVPGTINKHKLDDFFSPMIKQSIRDIKNQGFIKDKIQIQCSLDVRYTGQSYELNIPYSKYFIDAFHEKHSSAYGYSYTEKPIEIVNIRVRSTGIVPPISLPCSNNVTPNPMLPLARYVQVEMREGPEYIPMYTYDQLLPGIRIEGPAMILSTDTTIFTNKHDKTYVDKFLNLLIDINRSD